MLYQTVPQIAGEVPSWVRLCLAESRPFPGQVFVVFVGKYTRCMLNADLRRLSRCAP